MLRDTDKKYMIGDNFIIKFVTKAGMKLRDILQNITPLEDKCDDTNCNIYSQTDENNKFIRKPKCRKNNIVYEDKCKDCDLKGEPKLYHRET